MNLQEIQQRIAHIKAISNDPEGAHSAEDKLLLDFVRHVASSGHKPFAGMAAELLKVDEIDFQRWCA